ncbi:sulfatase [Sorangium sp. So ce118]
MASGRGALGSRPDAMAESLAGAAAQGAPGHRAPAAPRPQAGPARPSTPAPAPSRATFPSGNSEAPPRKLETEIGWRMADAYLALAALALAELVVVGALRWRELVGPYELGRAVRDLLPLALAAAAPCAALLGAVLEIVMRAERKGFRAAAALVAGAFGGAVAFGVSAGRMLEGGRRAPFVAALALLAAGATFAAAPRVARGLKRARAVASGRWLVLGAIAAVVLLEIANVRILPRLYLAFHLGLAALTLAAATFATPALPVRAARDGDQRERREQRSPRLVRAALALVLFAFGAALAPGAADRLALADNIRLIYATHGPLLGHVVELAAVLSPPEPLDAAPLDERASGHAIDLRGRDVVLISIDALRADHVGAYGYSRKITPNLDRLAAEGVRFEAAYTPTPHTSYAVSSLMTGKYIRPLVLQGLGEDSETFAQHLRRYGYKTAGFYPPAVFFIDGERFGALRDRALDFEYQKIEFASAPLRVEQVRSYLAGLGPEQRAFLWVHLFEPHEPYEAHPEHPLGDRDIDRYDAEIAVADAGVGAIVDEIRKGRPNAVVIVTADHGEEFGEHGGRYHGTTVYEEQARVPLIVSAPGLLSPRAVRAPVQLVDLLPTVLAGLGIPRPARVRGAISGRCSRAATRRRSRAGRRRLAGPLRSRASRSPRPTRRRCSPRARCASSARARSALARSTTSRPTRVRPRTSPRCAPRSSARCARSCARSRRRTGATRSAASARRARAGPTRSAAASRATPTRWWRSRRCSTTRTWRSAARRARCCSICAAPRRRRRCGSRSCATRTTRCGAGRRSRSRGSARARRSPAISWSIPTASGAASRRSRWRSRAIAAATTCSWRGSGRWSGAPRRRTVAPSRSRRRRSSGRARSSTRSRRSG